jgi:peptide/nickel transport system permease protein
VTGVQTCALPIFHLAPGDPARALVGPHANAETLAHARAHHGLDRPLPVQYLRYLGQVARGDLGLSYRTQRPVADILIERAWPTLQLTLAAALVQLLLGVPLGALAAARRGRRADRAVTGVAVLVMAAPPFVVATILLYAAGFRLGWLPINGYGGGGLDRLAHLILPALSVALVSIGTTALLLRAELGSALAADYVRTARAKGVSERGVLWRHALRPSLPPVLAALGVDLGIPLIGAVTVESIFGWPGLGREALLATLELDIPLVLGVVLACAFAIAVVTLVMDLAILAVDPRARGA